MNRVTALIGAALLAFSAQAAAETRIGVVDLRQALFASDDAQTFSQQLQRDFAEGVRLCPWTRVIMDPAGHGYASP